MLCLRRRLVLIRRRLLGGGLRGFDGGGIQLQRLVCRVEERARLLVEFRGTRRGAAAPERQIRVRRLEYSREVDAGEQRPESMLRDTGIAFCFEVGRFGGRDKNSLLCKRTRDA